MSRFRKILVTILHLFVLIQIPINVWNQQQKSFGNNKSDPTVIFRFGQSITYAFGSLAIVLSVWNKKLISKLFWASHGFQQTTFQNEGMTYNFRRISGWVWLLLLFCVTRGQLLYQSWFSMNHLLDYIQYPEGNSTKYIMRTVSYLSWIREYESEPWFTALVVVLMLLHHYTWSLSDFASWMPHHFWIMTNTLSGDVIEFLEQRPTFAEFSDVYNKIRDLLEKVNALTSTLSLLTIGDAVIIFSKYFNQAMDPSGGSEIKLYVLITIINNLIALFLAANANRNFAQIYDYIIKNRNREGFLSREAQFILSDLTENPLGVKCHTFIISNAFVATVLSTVITYVFLFAQFQAVNSSQ